MRIKVVSDLHLEFSDVNINNDQNCDVLILSGDILVARDLHDHPRTGWLENKEYLWKKGNMRPQCADRFRDFLDNCSKNFPHVIYIAGNHEFYHGKWYKTIKYLREETSYWPNIYFLEKDVKVINDVAFLGCTLWTDLNKNDPLTMYHVGRIMTDHRLIRNDQKNYVKVTPDDTAQRHREHIAWLRETVLDYDKIVVVGHMCPSYESIHINYRGDYLLNGGYASDLSNFILDNPQIKIWTHGHTHNATEYKIGETLVVCNPRGYEGNEPDSGWDVNKYYDI